MRANVGEVDGDLLNDDLELLLREINDFCGSKGGRGSDSIPKSLDDYLIYVAKTGNTVFPWNHVRNLFRLKLELAIGQFPGEPSVLESSVFERFDLFRSAPFTIQRLSELITEPNRHYKMKEKYMFALEKTVFVVSTVEPMSADHVNNGDSVEELESSNEFTEESTPPLNSSFIQHEISPGSGGSELTQFDEMESDTKHPDNPPPPVIPEANFIAAEQMEETPVGPSEDSTALETNTGSSAGLDVQGNKINTVVEELESSNQFTEANSTPLHTSFVQHELEEDYEFHTITNYFNVQLNTIFAISSSSGYNNLKKISPGSGGSELTQFDEMESDTKDPEIPPQPVLDVIPETNFIVTEQMEEIPVGPFEDSTAVETNTGGSAGLNVQGNKINTVVEELESSNEFTEQSTTPINTSFIQHEVAPGSGGSELTQFDDMESDMKDPDNSASPVVVVFPETNCIVSELKEETPVGPPEDSTALETNTEGSAGLNV